MSNPESTTIRVPLHMREFYIDVYTKGGWTVVSERQVGMKWELIFQRPTPRLPS